MCEVIYFKPIVNAYMNGKQMHETVRVARDVSKEEAEDICEEVAKTLKKKAFVIKNKQQILMKDFTQKESDN